MKTQTSYFVNGQMMRQDSYGLDGSVTGVTRYTYDKYDRLMESVTDDLLSYDRTKTTYQLNIQGSRSLNRHSVKNCILGTMKRFPEVHLPIVPTEVTSRLQIM